MKQKVRKTAKKSKTRREPKQKKSTALVLTTSTPTLPLPAATIKSRTIIEKSLTEQEILSAFDALGITAKLKTPQEKALFLSVAKAWNLNPLKREIHAVKIGGDEDDETKGILVPVVGYEVYLKRAEATGRLEYWNVTDTGSINRQDWKASDLTVSVTIKRRDQPREFVWKVRYTECVALKYVSGKRIPNSMWDKRGYFMTMKCATGQAFRLLFPEILGEMPYIDAEIEYQDAAREQIAPEPIKEPKAITVTVTTPAIALATNGASSEELNAAREELTSVFKKIRALLDKDKPADVKKVESMRVQAKAIEGDLAKLRDLATEWNMMYTDMVADGKAAKK